MGQQSKSEGTLLFPLRGREDIPHKCASSHNSQRLMSQAATKRELENTDSHRDWKHTQTQAEVFDSVYKLALQSPGRRARQALPALHRAGI